MKVRSHSCPNPVIPSLLVENNERPPKMEVSKADLINLNIKNVGAVYRAIYNGTLKGMDLKGKAEKK